MGTEQNRKISAGTGRNEFLYSKLTYITSTQTGRGEEDQGGRQ
jgi:hypothetical protein